MQLKEKRKHDHKVASIEFQNLDYMRCVWGTTEAKAVEVFYAKRCTAGNSVVLKIKNPDLYLIWVR